MRDETEQTYRKSKVGGGRSPLCDGVITCHTASVIYGKSSSQSARAWRMVVAKDVGNV